MITEDSEDYHVLTNAVEHTRNVPGLICEIGTRAGGSLKHIIDTLVLKSLRPRPIVCVDPYGWIDYPEGNKIVKHDYTNTMRDTCLKDIYGYLGMINAYPRQPENAINVIFQIMEDLEFFERFVGGVPVYDRGSKKVYNNYSLAFLDGPHSAEAVKDEFDFFSARMQTGAAIVCDDIGMYDHGSVEVHMLKNGFEILEKTPRKASYVAI
jgi:hypothetical protein